MSDRLRFTTARQVFEAFPTAAADIEVEPADEAPLDFARKLLAPGGASRRSSTSPISCRGGRRSGGAASACGPSAETRRTTPCSAAEAWVRDPDESTRRAALNLGWTRDARIATTWLALAAGQSGGSITPEDAHPVAPPPQATALDVKAAVILAIAQSPPPGQSAWLSACVEAGIRFAEGGDAKVRAPAAAASKPDAA